MHSVEIHWENGRLKRSVSFQDGVREGVDQMWSEEGILIDEGFYSKGLPVGVHRRWDAKGALIEEVHFDASPGNGFPLLMERYPRLGLLAPRWIPKEASFEPVTSFSLENIDAIYVYGLGCGAPYFQMKHWLGEEKRRKLIFLEDEAGHFAHFLRTKHSETLLLDPQVHIEWLEDKKELGMIADAFPFSRIEVVKIPSKNQRRFQSLKEELLRKTALFHVSYQDRLYGHYLFQNFMQNLRHVPSSFYANGLEGAFKSLPAIVCGAGPSLQKAIPLLKTLANRALIIAGGSSIAALSSQGVPIHFGMVVDPNLEEVRRMKNSFAFDTPILYSTRTHPGVFHTCNGPFGYMRSGMGNALESWMEESLGLRGPSIGEDLSLESLSVTNLCTAWAQFLGCKTILFSGVDLAYTNKKRYAEGVSLSGEMSFPLSAANQPQINEIIVCKNRKGRPVQTALRWVMESRSLSEYAQKHKRIRFLNTTEGGLPIRGVSYMSLSQAAEKYLINTYDFKHLIYEKIKQSPMPKSAQESIATCKREIQESLLRVIEHLEILSLKKKGSEALAELDLQEELATRLLFYDALEILEKRKMEGSKWDHFLAFAKTYCIR